MASYPARGQNMGPSSSNQSIERGRARESKAWAGMMMSSNVSDDSDSDSDDGDRLQPMSSSSRRPSATSSAVVPSDSGGSGSRASWSQRAAAVGSRPPDTASQNPPTLKLLGLKSLKDGGPPVGSMYEQPPVSPAVSMRQQIERRQQEEMRKRDQTLLVEQQREAARNRAPSPAPGYNDGAQKVSVDQLHVKSSYHYGDDTGRHGSMINFGGTDGFGGSTVTKGRMGGAVELRDNAPSSHAAPTRPPIHTLPPPQNPYEDRILTPRTELTQQLGLSSNPHARPPSPAAQSQTTASNSPTRSLLTASTSSSGASPPHRPAQVGGMPRALVAGPGMRLNDNSIPLQRGPPPHIQAAPNGQRLGPPPPQPIPLPSPTYPKAMPEPRVAAYDSLTRGPGGFSNQQRDNTPVRRPSLFRRSKAFLMGDQGRPRQGGVSAGSQAQRRSLFRRSMAMLSGRGQPQSHAQQVQSYEADDDSNAPAPRVQGFIDDEHKERRSIYLGGGGMGDEWDFQGYGAKFWKRFSVAQRKLQDGEFADADEVRRKTQKRRKWTMIISLLGGVTIIAAVIAVVIWRENVKSSYLPGALDREKNGAGTDLDQQLSLSSAAAAAATATQAQTSVANASATSAAGGTTANTDDTGSTTTRKKKKKDRKNDGGDRRRRDEADASAVRREVERMSPISTRTLSVEEIGQRGLDWHTSMVRRKQHRRAVVHAAHSP